MSSCDKNVSCNCHYFEHFMVPYYSERRLFKISKKISYQRMQLAKFVYSMVLKKEL